MSDQTKYDEEVEEKGDDGEQYFEHVECSDEGEEDHDGESASVCVVLCDVRSRED